VRERLRERLARDVEAEQGGGDSRLELRCERRLEELGLECGIAGRLRAERIERRGQVPVGSVRLDERHRGGDGADQPLVDLPRGVGGSGRRRRCLDRELAVPVVSQRLEQP
jgi:hypothetical protein